MVYLTYVHLPFMQVKHTYQKLEHLGMSPDIFRGNEHVPKNTLRSQMCKEPTIGRVFLVGVLKQKNTHVLLNVDGFFLKSHSVIK